MPAGAAPHGRGAGQVAIVLVAVYVAFWVPFSAVRATNFGGVDEWMILSLVSRGAVDIPYANRPLGLLFNLPAAVFPAHLLQAAALLHAHYMVMVGMLTALLLLRLAPERPHWALLAGTFAATWAPSDLMRLNPIYSSAYSGVTAATALVLLLLGTGQGRWVWVAPAAGVAFLTTRVHEGPLPVLLLAPLLLLALGVRLPRRALALYWGAMGMATLVVALPLLLARSAAWYQNQVLGLYLDPMGLASRLLLQFRLHLEPLFTTAPAQLLKPRPLLSALVLVFALAVLPLPAAEDRAFRRRLASCAAAALLAAGAAYSSFILAAKLSGALRTQFLAAPWIGLALASSIALLAGLAPPRWRVPLMSLLGAAVVACGAARTAQLQASWDATGAYERQSSALKQMLEVAPDLRPDTLVLFIEGPPTWIGSFALHHALDIVYGPHVAGCVSNERARLFYDCRQTAEGLLHQSWPVLRAAWRAEPRAYRFDEVVVFRADDRGDVTLLDEWPPELPGMPEAARYSPRLRIVSGTPPPTRRAGLPGL